MEIQDVENKKNGQRYYKILFELEQDTDNYPPVKYESVWAIKNDNLYIIDSIPFFIYNVSLGDLVSIKERDGELWFNKIEQQSKNSTIRVYCPSEISWKSLKSVIESRFCKWEMSHIYNLVAINIDTEENFKLIISTMDEIKLNDTEFDYEEAAIRYSPGSA